MAVYFIEGAEDRVKIGFTRDKHTLHSRISSLQTSSPVKLDLWGVLDLGHSGEQRIHRILRGFRGVGEWFDKRAAKLAFDVLHGAEDIDEAFDLLCIAVLGLRPVEVREVAPAVRAVAAGPYDSLKSPFHLFNIRSRGRVFRVLRYGGWPWPGANEMASGIAAVLTSEDAYVTRNIARRMAKRACENGNWEQKIKWRDIVTVHANTPNLTTRPTPGCSIPELLDALGQEGADGIFMSFDRVDFARFPDVCLRRIPVETYRSYAA